MWNIMIILASFKDGFHDISMKKVRLPTLYNLEVMLLSSVTRNFNLNFFSNLYTICMCLSCVERIHFAQYLTPNYLNQ